MVERYYLAVKARINETHAVHRAGCPFLPDVEKRIYLGVFDSVMDAVKESQKFTARSKGCLFCSEENEDSQKITFMDTRITNDPVLPELKMPVLCFQSLICCVN